MRKVIIGLTSPFPAVRHSNDNDFDARLLRELRPLSPAVASVPLEKGAW